MAPRLIVVDPRRIKMTEFAQHWLRPNLGTDVAWINGMMHVILKEKLHAKNEFIKTAPKGSRRLPSAWRNTPRIREGITGIPAESLIDAARLFAGAKAGSILYCMGITQHISGTDNVKSLANLAMLTGNLGMPGAGVNPLRGQNNVQGACDMGGLPNVYTGLPAGERSGRGQEDGGGLGRDRPAHPAGAHRDPNGPQGP
jgi:formate dehydrogenase major subunit